MNWIKKEQKHSEGSKEKCDVQISDLPRSGSMPSSFFFLILYLPERAENSRVPLKSLVYPPDSSIIQTLIFRYSIHQVLMSSCTCTVSFSNKLSVPLEKAVLELWKGRCIAHAPLPLKKNGHQRWERIKPGIRSKQQSSKELVSRATWEKAYSHRRTKICLVPVDQAHRHLLQPPPAPSLIFPPKEKHLSRIGHHHGLRLN